MCHLVGFNLDLDLAGSTGSVSTAAQVKNLKIHKQRSVVDMQVSNDDLHVDAWTLLPRLWVGRSHPLLQTIF